jgi:hypothetical protein
MGINVLQDLAAIRPPRPADRIAERVLDERQVAAVPSL